MGSKMSRQKSQPPPPYQNPLKDIIEDIEDLINEVKNGKLYRLETLKSYIKQFLPENEEDIDINFVLIYSRLISNILKKNNSAHFKIINKLLCVKYNSRFVSAIDVLNL